MKDIYKYINQRTGPYTIDLLILPSYSLIIGMALGKL